MLGEGEVPGAAVPAAAGASTSGEMSASFTAMSISCIRFSSKRLSAAPSWLCLRTLMQWTVASPTNTWFSRSLISSMIRATRLPRNHNCYQMCRTLQ